LLLAYVEVSVAQQFPHEENTPHCSLLKANRPEQHVLILLHGLRSESSPIPFCDHSTKYLNFCSRKYTCIYQNQMAIQYSTTLEHKVQRSHTPATSSGGSLRVYSGRFVATELHL
jgi:hypothetical protein